MTAPPVSVIISCFNYERYVREAIESALGQDHLAPEVIVVDDGSEDRSREVIASFGDRVTAIFQQNGGQASALNTGFAASHGSAVIFLDADDVLLPNATETVVQALADRTVAKAHWSMPIVDASSKATGELQDPELAEGDLREFVLRDGPLSDITMPSPPMSGNAFARWFLDRVVPIPEALYRTAADEYLFGLAPAFGSVARLDPQSRYRVHGENEHMAWSFERMLAFQIAHHSIVSSVVEDACRSAGDTPDTEAWSRSSWWLRAGRVVTAIESAVPVGAGFALVDGGSLGIEGMLRGRVAIPFPEAGGEFAGSPADDEEAVGELDRVAARAAHVAVVWPAFWWLEEYPALARALSERFRTLVDTPDVIIFGAGDPAAR